MRSKDRYCDKIVGREMSEQLLVQTSRCQNRARKRGYYDIIKGNDRVIEPETIFLEMNDEINQELDEDL